MEEYDGVIDTWCPLFDSYDNPMEVEKYREQNEELWWYGCIAAKSPYSSVHIDNTMYSPRIESWLKSQYGVTGNLYWSVDQWAYYNIVNGVRAYRYVDDYYSIAGPYDGVEGEGFLFRPGKKYGIDGPIPTIRLDAIRDGLEEYELMESLKKTYAQVGELEGREFSANTTIDDLLSKLASGVKIGTTLNDFNAARTLLLDLSEFANAGVCFTNMKDDGSGNLEYQVYVRNGNTLQVQNAGLKSVENLTNGVLKTYTVNLQNATANYVSFNLTTEDGATKELRRPIASGLIYHDAASFVDTISGDVDLNATLLVPANTLIANREGSLLQLSLTEINGANSFGYQYIRITSDNLKDINADASKAVFTYYYAGTENLAFNMYVKYKNKRALVLESMGTFTTGSNEVVWGNLNTKDWSTGNIEYIEFCFGNATVGTLLPARSDIYFDSLAIYGA